MEKSELFPGNLIHWQQSAGQCDLICDNGVMLRLHFLGPHIIRFRFCTQGHYEPDFSYAPDPQFQPEAPKIKILERTNMILIKGPSLNLRIKKAGLSIQILNASGQLLTEDEKGFHWEVDSLGNDIVQMSKKAQPDEAYFGLGDKSCPLNLRGERLQNWVTDCFGYSSETDPLYRAVPFYYGLHKGLGYGIFFDNSFRTHFDFAKERKEVTSFWADGGEMNYYFIQGPELMQVAARYALLTGRPELPPLWTMGFHQCKWSYYPESRVKEIAHEFRSREIPCDAIYLDIDYMDGYRCFTWNRNHFPDPTRLIKELAADGFKTVVIIDPGIKIDPHYEVYRQGLEQDVYCRRSDGPYVKEKVWPGLCLFPDFTRPAVRKWWAKLFRELIRKNKVNGVWNDMNEPAAFEVPTKTFPLDVRHDLDGHPSSHRQAHNVYGMQMSRASYEGVKEYAYPERPFLITRATFAGGQRYASAWTGDNVASWDHLELASVQSQRMSISGFSFIGSDIGGFNDTPDGELFVRWVQMGVFHPLFRVHSIGYHDLGDAEIDEDSVQKNMESEQNRDQEPWSFGEPYTQIAKAAIELRYRLLPYLYSTFWQYVSAGTPVLRPLSFLDQQDSETHNRMEEFCLGDHLLACPISEPQAKGRILYLPQGLWYDFHTDEAHKGQQEVWKETSLEDIPMYVRAGAVLPLGPVKQYSAQPSSEPLELHVYYGLGETASTFYVDAGNGYEYQSGGYRLAHWLQIGHATECVLRQNLEGEFQPEFPVYRIIMHGLPFEVQQVLADGVTLPFQVVDQTLVFEAPLHFLQLNLT